MNLTELLEKHDFESLWEELEFVFIPLNYKFNKTSKDANLERDSFWVIS